MRTPIRSSSTPKLREKQDGIGPIEVTVLHTNVGATCEAIRTAARLSKELYADIRILVLQVVPYPLPLDTPDVPIEFTQQCLLDLAARAGVEVSVDIHLGRDKEVMLQSAIPLGGLVLIGRRRWWWPTAESKVARLLRHLGHQVVYTGSE